MNSAFDAAIAEYREAIRIQPDYADAYEQLGWVYRLEGKLAEAMTAVGEGLRFKPDDVELAILRSALVEKAEGLEPSLAGLRVAAERNPLSARIRDHWGYTLENRGRRLEAVPLYLQAIRLEGDWPSTNARTNLAGLLSSLAASVTTLRAAREWMEIKPDDPLARRTFDRLSSKLERVGEEFPADPFAHLGGLGPGRLPAPAPSCAPDRQARPVGCTRRGGSTEASKAGFRSSCSNPRFCSVVETRAEPMIMPHPLCRSS